jgi:hypothetical protein
MSIYSELSAKIGFEFPSLNYPSLETVRQLKARALVHNDIQAFQDVIMYCRFLKAPVNEKEKLIQTMLHEICNKGQDTITNMYEANKEIIDYIKNYYND